MLQGVHPPEHPCEPITSHGEDSHRLVCRLDLHWSCTDFELGCESFLLGIQGVRKAPVSSATRTQMPEQKSAKQPDEAAILSRLTLVSHTHAMAPCLPHVGLPSGT